MFTWGDIWAAWRLPLVRQGSTSHIGAGHLPICQGLHGNHGGMLSQALSKAEKAAPDTNPQASALSPSSCTAEGRERRGGGDLETERQTWRQERERGGKSEKRVQYLLMPYTTQLM